MLGLGGFIILQSNKRGIYKTVGIVYGNYTYGLLDYLIHNVPNYNKYESFEPSTSKSH